MALNTVVV